MTDRAAHNTNTIRNAISTGSDFAFFNTGLSAAENALLDKLHVTSTSVLDNFGNLNSIKIEITEFLQTLGNDSETSTIAANIIEQLVEQSRDAFNAKTAWVGLRASVPNSQFDIPRWHTDGYFYEPYQGTQHKVAFVSKGNGTLFGKLNDQWRQAFQECMLRHNYVPSIKMRTESANLIAEHGVVQIAERKQGVVFAVGTPEISAIHSEPPITEARLFLSIVSGSDQQIASLASRWAPVLAAKNKAAKPTL